MACLSVKAGLTAGGEYYIWLNIYEKLLGADTTNTVPALTAFDVNDDKDGYVFVAESSGKDGYVLLKQKSTGKYLAATGSSGNTWDIVFENNRSTDDRFCWKMTGYDCYAYLTNKKSSGKYVGIDGANKSKKQVSIYYDKPKGSHGQFSVIPAKGSWDEARQAYDSGDYINAQGVNEIDYCQLNNKTIDRSDAVDIHITSNDNPMLDNSSVNLGSDRTWLIFDNIVPSKVISTYLQYVTIDGAPAVKDENCRVAIYLNGAAVIPIPETVMSCDGTEGVFDLAVGSHTNLGELSNTMTSFTLRRGYMATLATEANGSGHSRVYVADHADLTVILPKALDRRVSSVYVKKWQYLSKKGWGNTGGSSGASGLRATWYWSWSAAYWSNNDMEYVPCRQHRWWPSVSEVNSHASSATLSINEPEHSEQHAKSDCDCSGEWKNCTFMPDYQASGARIGGAQPTDFTWMNTFFGHVDDMAYRCDFAVTHAYWDLGSYSESGYADWFCNTKCKSVWNSTKRPVWLTEMEISASWNSNKIKSYEQNRKYLQVLLQKIEECPWIERYAIYGTDMSETYMYYEANPSKGLTPAGQVYRDHRSTFAYDKNYTKEPVWWEPSLKTPELAYEVNLDEQSITFTVRNTNGDATDELLIEYQPENGNWQTLADLGVERNKLESSSLTYTKNLSDLDVSGGKFRVSTTTLYGKSATSSEVKAPIVSDLETLLPLIAETEALPFGFGRGEYAPYNNVEALQALAVVKAMKPYEADFQSSCQNLANAVWTANTVEQDAIYDGTFAKAPIQATSENVVLPGWVTESGNMRQTFKGSDSKACLADAIDQVGLFVHPGTYTYGTTPGYTMPLEAEVDYVVEAKYCAWAANSNNDFTLTVKKDGQVVATESYGKNEKACTEAGALRKVSLSFTSTTAGNYVLSVGANGNTFMTDFTLRKAVSSEMVSVGETGYATYVSGNDLDFSETAIKAYKAAVSEGFVVLTPINQVKAGTPVVLYYKGGNKEEDIPYATSADAATGNLLKAGEGKAVSSDGGNGVVNCILNKVGGQIGFYRANGQVVAWNRAYLPVSTNTSRLGIVFADETTGVSLVKSEGVQDEKIYNLNGQRVSLPKQGVYVVSGKKVIK